MVDGAVLVVVADSFGLSIFEAFVLVCAVGSFVVAMFVSFGIDTFVSISSFDSEDCGDDDGTGNDCGCCEGFSNDSVASSTVFPVSSFVGS